MVIERLLPVRAVEYRALMLEAYAAHPEAFTSSVAERAGLPLAWWDARLSAEPTAQEVVLGALQDDEIAGVIGLSFEQREKVRHKVTLFGMYVRPRWRRRGLGRRLVQAALEHARE